MLPTVIFITFFSASAGSLADRLGPRLQMIIGPLIVSIGTGSLAFVNVSANYFTSFFPGLALIGTGMALVIAPLTKSALSVDSEFSGAASGVNNAAARIAALLAVAILGVIMVLTFTTRLSLEINQSTLSPIQRQQILEQSDKLAGIVVPSNFDQNETSLAHQAITNSFIYGFRLSMITTSVLAFIACAVSFFTIHNPVKNK